MANKNQAETKNQAEASTTSGDAQTPAKIPDVVETDSTASSPDGSTAPNRPAQRVKTIDSSESDIGWTNQQGARPVPPEEAPVVYAKEQLATVEGLREQGIDPKSYLANYHVDDAHEGVKAEEQALQASAEQASTSAQQWDEVQAEVEAGPATAASGPKRSDAVPTPDPRTDKAADGGPGDPRTHR